MVLLTKEQDAQRGGRRRLWRALREERHVGGGKAHAGGGRARSADLGRTFVSIQKCRQRGNCKCKYRSHGPNYTKSTGKGHIAQEKAKDAGLLPDVPRFGKAHRAPDYHA